MDFLASDLVDAHEATVHACTVQFRQFGAKSRFHGPVRTLKTLEDNALLRQIISSPGNGSVLVVDGEGSLRCALLGDMMAGIAVQNGWAGLILWAAVRDTVALANLDIGIKALGTNPVKSRKTGYGTADIPVRFGDVTFRPGDWVYSDEDGLIVSPTALF